MDSQKQGIKAVCTQLTLWALNLQGLTFLFIVKEKYFPFYSQLYCEVECGIS
jgi:hypothetical protein